jgi:hypothetical protein
MKFQLFTQKEIRELSQDFSLKGRSKIRSFNDFVKALSDQEFEKEAMQYKSIHTCIKNAIKRTQIKLSELPEDPKHNLKGNNHKRESLALLPIVDFSLFSIPQNHHCQVASRVNTKYFSWHTYVSPEAYKIFYNYSKLYEVLYDKLKSIKSPKAIERDNIRAKLVEQKRIELANAESFVKHNTLLHLDHCKTVLNNLDILKKNQERMSWQQTANALVVFIAQDSLQIYGWSNTLNTIRSIVKNSK